MAATAGSSGCETLQQLVGTHFTNPLAVYMLLCMHMAFDGTHAAWLSPTCCRPGGSRGAQRPRAHRLCATVQV